MTIYREYPCDIVVYMKFYGNPFQLCSECGTNHILTYCHTLRLLWHLPLHFLQYQQQQPLFHFNHPQSSKLWKKQFSPAVSNVEVGCERAPNYASWGGLQITVTAAKNCLLFLDFFPILLVYFCNLTHLHTTVWCESCQSCFF